MHAVRGHEVVFVRGRGCEIEDRDGNLYLDATAALWYCNVGYGRSEIARRIGEQAAELSSCTCFDVYASDRTLELADRVAAMAPVDDAVVFLTSGGSDSIDTAAKVAVRYWYQLGRPEKTVIISRESSYHGMHAYGTSIAGIAANREHYGGLSGGTAVVPAMDAAALASTIDRLGADRVAAFFAEPIIGAGGVVPPPEDYLREVAEICRDRDVLFVADEVISGFGRSGHWFACERYGIRPDALVLAKGITSGYLPLGAVVFSGRVAQPFWDAPDAPMMRHGYTYSGHATACVAALANLDIIERETLVERVAELEPELRAALAPLAELDHVSEVRSAGLLAGVQLDSRSVAAAPDLGARVVARCRELGVLTRLLAGDALHVSPAFVVQRPQLDRIASVMAEAITLETAAVEVA
jgi:adenosylmethionine-8-amino-7-oxononanoate aminotransferase